MGTDPWRSAMDDEGNPQAMFLSTDDLDDGYLAAGIGQRRPSLVRNKRQFFINADGRSHSYEKSTVTQAERTYHAILSRWLDSMQKRYPHLTQPHHLKLSLPQIRLSPALQADEPELRGRSATREPANGTPKRPLLSDTTGKRRRHSWREPSSDIYTLVEESEMVEQATHTRPKLRKRNPLTQIFCCNDIILRARL